MSVAGFQTVLGRMLASSRFFDAVRSDPRTALRSFRLSSVERKQLSTLSVHPRVALYGDSVRTGKVDFLLSGVLAYTSALLPPDALRASLERYIEAFPSVSYHPLDPGRLAVMRWLQRDLPFEKMPPFMRDVVRFERSWCEVQLAGAPRKARSTPMNRALELTASLRVAWYNFDVPGLHASWERGVPIDGIRPRRAAWGIWHRDGEPTPFCAHPSLITIAAGGARGLTGEELARSVERSSSGLPQATPIRVVIRRLLQDGYLRARELPPRSVKLHFTSR